MLIERTLAYNLKKTGNMASPPEASVRPLRRAHSLPLEESDIGIPPSRQHKERLLLSTALSDAQEVQGEQIDALMQQMSFLKDQVRRLNAELAAYQGAAKHSPAHEPDFEGSPQPLPAALRDSSDLMPLMVAYDQRLAEQEKVIVERTTRSEELSVQVDALVSENEKLLSEVQHWMQVAQKEKIQEGSPGLGSESDVLARVDMLSRENDLLVEQQGELEAELSRAQRQLTVTTSENTRLAREHKQLLERAEAAESALEQVSRERGSRQMELRQLAEEYDKVIEQVTKLKAEKQAAEERASECQRQLEASQTQSHADFSALQAQHASLQERARASADARAAAARDTASLRDRCASSERALAAAREEADEMRKTMGSMEQRLKEHQAKDVAAFQNLARAKDEAEDARMERARALSKLAQAEEEVASLTKRLAVQRTDLVNKREADLAAQSQRFEHALNTARDESRQLESQCAELRAQLERALRDRKSGEAEMELLKARAVHVVPGKLEDVSKQAALMAAAIARAEEAEKARDEALEKVARLSHAAQRSMNQWERERSALLAQAADLGRQLQRVEAELDDKLALLQQWESTVEELGRSNRALSRGQAKVEKKARDEVQAARLEKETQVRALKLQLKEAVEAYERSAREAEELIAAKERLVNRWREEAQQVSSAFEAASAEQRKEIGRLMARVEDLTNRAQAGQATIDAQEDAIQNLRRSFQALKPAYEALERRAAALRAQLSLSSQREEQLLAARKELRCQVDQAAVERARADRAREAATRRNEELTWQLREAQSAMESVALLPLEVNVPTNRSEQDEESWARKEKRRSSRSKRRTSDESV